MKGTNCALLGMQSIEEELEETKLNLLHASRLALTGQLLSAILHEMQQPLTAVRLRAKNGADLIGAAPGSSEALRAIFDDIEGSVAFATDIIDRLRLLSDKRPLELTPVDLNEAIEQVAAIAEIQARARGITLRLIMTQGLPPIRADRVSLQHAVLDLVVNGMDALDDDGERMVTVDTRPTAGWLEIRVIDTGAGIAPRHRARLFEPFFTTKPEGTGLGLPIARSIVEAHGGRIAIEDREEAGACFRIRLPIPGRPS